MIVGKLNLLKYATIPDGTEALVKIRYKDTGAMGRLYNDGNAIRVEFDASVKAIAPGQSAVFFDGDDVLGGGIIFSGTK
jgi:tRNA-specific 2-thiouridylase